MSIFADSATSLLDGRSDSLERQRAWSMFEKTGLPTTTDEVWRYAPLSDFHIDRFQVTSEPVTHDDTEFARQLCERSGLVVRVVDCFVTSSGDSLDGVQAERLTVHRQKKQKILHHLHLQNKL